MQELPPIIIKLPLYEYIGGIFGQTMPVPLMNILNGGVHANNGLEFQEFMDCSGWCRKLQTRNSNGCRNFYSLKDILRKRELSTGVGDEGGFCTKSSDKH